MKYIIEPEKRQMRLEIILLPVQIYIVMLSVGALGHYLNQPFLFKFNYLNTFLAIVAMYPFRGASTRKWQVKKEK